MNFPAIRDEPDFTRHFNSEIWQFVARQICQRHRISPNVLQRATSGEHVVFLADDSLIIKIYKPYRNGFRRERAALRFAQGKTNLPIPEILFEGEIEQFNYLVLTQQRGVSVTRETWLKLETPQQIQILSQLADGLKQLHSHPIAGAVDFDWHRFIEHQAVATLERQKSSGVNPRVLERLPEYIAENLPLLPKDFLPVFLHGDIHFGNLRLTESASGAWRITGLFDFADSLAGFFEFDLIAIGVLMIQGQGNLQREFFRHYGYTDDQINESLRRRLMLLTILYDCSDLKRYALRLRPAAVEYTLDELERAIWNFV
jgi:hygromycin-B 7''-O-kinase